MMKNFYTILFCTLLCSGASAQLIISAIGTAETVDFTGFDGSGFSPTPGAGQLNSNTWSVTGFSDGDVLFGDTEDTGDFARGTTTGGETEGGIYGASLFGDQVLMVQPGDDDFTPGSFILKIENASGSTIGQLDIDYLIYNLNDEDRSSSFNFSYSYDNSTYTDLTDLNYTSPETGDGSLFFEFKAASITGLLIADGEDFYLRWIGDDVSGSGFRDEFALDNIMVEAIDAGTIPFVAFSTASLSTDEVEGVVEFDITIDAAADCDVNLFINVSSTAIEGDDYFYTIVSPVEFTDGGATSQTLSLDILEDGIDEEDETISIDIVSASGTCLIGTPASITVTIIDNDDTPVPAVAIADVHAEDAEGVCSSIGSLVSITGIVYGVNLSDDGLQFTLIDNTAGINVFSFDNTFGYTVTEGDALTVIGTIDQFNGLTEIIPDTLFVNSTGNVLNAAAEITVLNETTESKLVHTSALLNFVDPGQWLGDGTSFNVDVTDGTNIWTMRIDNNTELSSSPFSSLFEMPDLLFDGFEVSGIGSQFDTSNPFTDGYQLFPRYQNDFETFFSVNITESPIAEIKLYPNPATDYIRINATENIESIQLINQLGEIVQIISVNASQKTTGISTLPAGFYTMKIKTETGVSSSNFIKQ